MFRYFELDPKEYREEQDAYNEHDVNVRLFPTKTRCLVPCEVEQDHRCDAHGRTKQIELGYPLLQGEVLIFLLKRYGR